MDIYTIYLPYLSESGPIFTIILPKFSPLKSPRNVFGAFSILSFWSPSPRRGLSNRISMRSFCCFTIAYNPINIGEIWDIARNTSDVVTDVSLLYQVRFDVDMWGNICALKDEPLSCGKTYATISSCNNCDFSFKFIHDFTSFW